MSDLRIAIVDDEPLVRQGLADFLSAETGVQIVGEARNGAEALQLIRDERPDAVFLDVQMPEVDGFGVLAALDGEWIPAIVFVTAFDEYAIRAFDVHAVDYLLKPFDHARFQLAVARLRERVSVRGTTPGDEAVLSENIRAVLASLRARDQYAERLLVKRDGGSIVVSAGDIHWIEAADNYVRLHTNQGALLLRETISALELRLDPRQFIRVHRSAIVNMSRIKQLQPMFNGETSILLSTGARLTLGRTYRAAFREKFGLVE